MDNSAYTCIKYNMINNLRKMLEEGYDIDSVNKEGETLLLYSIKLNRIDSKIIDILLKYGSNVNIVNKDGLTPLMLAVRRNNMDNIEKLMKYNVNPFIKCNDMIALDIAIEFNLVQCYVKIMEYMNKLKWKWFNAIRKRNYYLVNSLINKKTIDIDITLGYNVTGIMIACENNDIQMAKLLLLNDANPNTKKNNGCTSLHIACKNNNIELVKLLLGHGANKNLINNRYEKAINNTNCQEIITLLQNYSYCTNNIEYDTVPHIVLDSSFSGQVVININ